ncbi:Cell cycle serine/threonine-protein kinase cdc5/MSD2 [Tulasnella sp. 424]|nr:Cell cycle serine/threonine-protein kinase cdc5/MSD2 [Tulasnella sp. 424]KAG8973233.1 Cell cycle serine/threonine-protein kinase cdc5/MSD2 [Tulasnella sp. 425]
MATYAPRAPAAAYRRSAKYDDKDYRQQPFQPPHQPQHQRAAPPVPPKDDAPAPLPRQNSKTTPPSPPRVIRDTSKGSTFTRIGFLGEGGFARVYEVADLRGERSAVKVVTKSSLKTKKSKTKLFAEIKLHGSLLHPNIVGFEGCFEDTEYVYMKLELCTNGSMMDMLRQRRRFSEPEARFYLVQVLGACYYMHTHNVIHRDLKLGNLFLDSNMNVKVGDFGLAALIETPGERKKTICGTPNYIAPEVLFDTANGHSFEVDTWSIGVILYTLVVGKPPFQTKDVKAIYQRIRENNYEFPPDRDLSEEVQHLVSQILTPDPLQRPTLFEIVDHPFFVEGPVPSHIPSSALQYAPSFPGVTRSVSRNNLARLRRQCMLDEDAGDLSTLSNSMATMNMAPRAVAQTAAQQERDFQKAVAPASPISALLNSARQPLVVGPAGATGMSPLRSSSLMRKLTAAAPQQGGQASALTSSSSSNVPRSPPRTAKQLATLVEQEEDEVAAVLAKEERNRTRELESQKARIVAQMVPDGEDAAKAGREDDEDERENVPPVGVPRDRRKEEEERERDRRRREREREKEREKERERERERERIREQQRRRAASGVPESTKQAIPQSSKGPVTNDAAAAGSSANQAASGKLHGFEQVAETLARAFEEKDNGRLFRDPRDDADLEYEHVFIVSWVDYCNKYGMGYALTDGTIGVHFNDSTTLLLSPNKENLDYISSRRAGSVYVRKHFGVSAEQHPEELTSKVYLLKHFEAYMMERLYGNHSFCWDDTDRAEGMDFVQKYFRMKNVIVFKLSNEAIQFNFYDHTKMILSAKGHGITYLDKHYRKTHHSLSEIMQRALNPSTNESQRKAEEKLLNKLKYCKEVLLSIKTIGSSTTGSDS